LLCSRPRPRRAQDPSSLPQRRRTAWDQVSEEGSRRNVLPAFNVPDGRRQDKYPSSPRIVPLFLLPLVAVMNPSFQFPIYLHPISRTYEPCCADLCAPALYALLLS
jgi:hypothetical protein